MSTSVRDPETLQNVPDIKRLVIDFDSEVGTIQATAIYYDMKHPQMQFRDVLAEKKYVLVDGENSCLNFVAAEQKEPA